MSDGIYSNVEVFSTNESIYENEAAWPKAPEIADGIYSNADVFSTNDSVYQNEAAVPRVPQPDAATSLQRYSLDSFDETENTIDEENEKKRFNRDSTELHDISTKNISNPSPKRPSPRPPSTPSNSSRSVCTCKCTAITIFVLLGLLTAAGLLVYYIYGQEKIICLFGLSACKGIKISN